MRLSLKIALFLLLGALHVSPAHAARLEPAQESRANALFHELRCIVCAGQSVAESPAAVARDIRTDVRKRVSEGESDEAIKEYLISRYGEQIVLKPSLAPRNYLLWFGPLLILFLGVAIIFAYLSAGRMEKR